MMSPSHRPHLNVRAAAILVLIAAVAAVLLLSLFRERESKTAGESSPAAAAASAVRAGDSVAGGSGAGAGNAASGSAGPVSAAQAAGTAPAAATQSQAAGRGERSPFAPPPGRAPDVLREGERWKDAQVVSESEWDDPAEGVKRRVRLIQPADLPYPVRVEEAVLPDGSVRIVSEMVANRFLVKPAAGAEEDFLGRVAAMGARVEKLGASGLYRVWLPHVERDGVLEAIAGVEDGVAYAEPDYIVHTLAAPNDPLYLDGSLWGLHNTGQNGGVADADIDAPEGWDIRTSAPGVVVGVIDTGVRYTHEDIAANMWVNPGEDGLDAFGNSKRTNGVDDDGNGYVDDVHGINAINRTGNPMDDNGHGTHCAGTIAAVGNNGIGVVGVAWETKIMALKFLGASGGGALSDAILCIDYANAHGAAFTSNSWGGDTFSRSIFDAVARARDAGRLFIAAAGNSEADNDVTPMYPASFALENVISVAATNRQDGLAWFSNYGAGTVEVGAPGQDIRSLGISSDSDYRNLSGTSMATPHVSGLAALLHAQFPASDAFGIRNRILRGGRPLAALQGITGSGRIINLPGSLTTTTDAPPNDDFASAFPISAINARQRGTNRHATTEASEPLHAGHNSRSVWFRFTAVNPGLTVIHTNGSAFDTTLAVYEGGSLGNLTLVGENDDDGSNTASRVVINAQPGVTYHIALAGKNGAQGYYELRLSGPPSEDNIANPAVPPRFPFTYYSDNSNASREAGEPLHAGQPGGGSLWLRFRLADYGAATQRVVLTTAGSAIDTLLAVYTAPTTNPTVADLAPVISNDNAPYGETQSEVVFLANATTTYWVAVDGKNNARGAVQLWAHVQPANDDFAGAIALPATANATIEVAQNVIALATREAGEPVHDNAAVGTSLWWTWSPPADGSYVIRTNSNTALGVYTGSGYGALALAAPDQNDGSGNSYVLLAGASAGTTYRIALDRRPNTSELQSIRLFIEPYAVVGYDNLATPGVMEGVPSAEAPVSFKGANQNAVLEPGEPTPTGNMTRTVWVKWTAPVSGAFSADTHWSKFDSTLAVYSGPPAAGSFTELTLLASDRHSGIHDDAWLTFNAVAGQTYYFQIGGHDTTQFGDFELNIKPFAPPANDNFANAEVLTGFFVQREVHNFGAGREPGEPDHGTNDDWHNDDDIFYYNEVSQAQQTLWYKWTPADASQARRTTASAFGSGTWSIVAVYETTAANPTFADLTMVTPGASMTWGSWWPWGEISWNAQLGKTYYIMLGTDMAGDNEVQTLTFWQNPNDNFETRQVIPSEESVTVLGANYAATRQDGEPTINNPWNRRGGRSQWFEWVAPSSGVYSIDTFGSHSKSYYGRTSPEPSRMLLQMILGVYTGNSITGLTQVATNAGMSIQDYNARVVFNAVAGTSYKIALDAQVGPGSFLNQHRTQWVFRCMTQLNIAKGSLANDNLADAEPIAGTYHHEFIDISYATREPGEPTHGTRALRSAWWKWIAPESGTFWVATASDIYSDNHNRLPGIAVYTGPSSNPTFPSLTKLAENHGGPDSHNPARTSFNAVAGRTYYIAVDTGGSTADFYGYGTGMFLGRAAPNDHFANATVVTGSRRTLTGHNIGSTEETGEPAVDPSWRAPDARNSSVWWRWTAPASGQVTIRNKPGSFIYTEMGVYTGSSVTGLTEVAKETRGIHFDNGKTYEERMDLACRSVTFNAVAGTTYHIMVVGSGYQKTSQGLITLHVEGQPGVPLDPTNLRVTRVTDTRADLTWVDEAVDESSYTIQRASSPSGPWTTVFESGEPDTTSWSDLEASGPRYYRVRAEGPGGVSGWVTASTEDNYPPEIGDIAAPIIPMNTSSDAIAFVISDDRTDPAALVVTVSSGNTTLLPNAGLVLGGSGANRTLTITPAAGLFGAADVTVSVSDGTHTTQRAVRVVVNEVLVPVPTSIALSPVSALLEPGQTRQFTAVLRDQWGQAISPQPAAFNWSVNNPAGGTVSPTGLLTAGSTAGNYQVTASYGGISGSAGFSVLGSSPSAASFTDSFNDGKRVNRDISGAPQWFYQKASGGLTVASGGGLTNALSFNSNNNAASFFAALPESVTLANEGDYLEVTFKYGRSATQSYHSGTRVGFFYQEGLPAADNYGTAVSPGWTMAGLDAAQGYLAGFPSGSNNQANIRKDTNASSNNSTATVNNYLVHNQGVNTGILGSTDTSTGLRLPSAGTVCTIRLRVEKTAAGVRVTAGLTPEGGSETTFFRDDTSSPVLTFNAIAFGQAATNQVNYYDDIAVSTNVGSGQQTPYDLWAAGAFPSGTPAAQTEPGADPDGDGVANLLEYALGSDPTDAASRNLPAVTTATESGQQRLALEFTPENLGGLRYYVEASNDLSDWSDRTDVTDQLQPGTSYTHTDSADLAATPRRFLRLRVVME